MLWWRSRGWVIHVRGYHVRWWRSNRWGRCGHWGRRGLVVHHVWCPRGLGRMLHWVGNGRRRGRRGTKMLLRWCHHMVRVRHYGRLARIVPGVVVGWLARAWPSREGLARGRGVILNGHSDEITVFTSCYRGNAECLRTQRRSRGRAFVSGGRWRLTVRIVAPVLERVGEMDMVLG